ncbi:MAG: DUF2795 domain-containing protein [Armatimonadetes bacterium]|nr:DUF2795 domain-containing protein [Armatimonadota bacterium]
MANDSSKAEVRAEAVQELLSGLEYPASHGDVMRHAREKEAPYEMISALEKLPDQNFLSALEVALAVRTVQFYDDEGVER